MFNIIKKAKRPMAWSMLLSMVLVFMFTALVSLVGIKPEKVAAGYSQPDTVTTEAGKYVYDEANLLDSSEEELIHKKILEVKEETGMTAYVFFVEAGKSDYDNNKEIQNIYDYGFDNGTVETDAVMLYFDYGHQAGYRFYDVYSWEGAQRYINSDRCSSIDDYIIDNMGDGNYYSACKNFVSRISYYYNYVPTLLRPGVQLIIAIVIGAFITLMIVANAGGKDTTSAATYMTNMQGAVTARRDDYIRTSVTKTRIESSSGSSGRSGGGHSFSSGGGRHV